MAPACHPGPARQASDTACAPGVHRHVAASHRHGSVIRDDRHHERMLRFMPVGDSMTIGCAGDFTWRYRMWQHLARRFGGPFEIVGPRSALYDTATGAPARHEYARPRTSRRGPPHLAGWGEGWLHMAPVIGEAVARAPGGRAARLARPDRPRLLHERRPDRRQRARLRRGGPRREPARPHGPPARDTEHPGRVRTRPSPPRCDRFNELLAKAVADLDDAALPAAAGLRARLVRHPPATRTTARTRARPASTSWRGRSRTRCTRRGAWAGVRQHAPRTRPPTPGAPLLVEAVGPALTRGVITPVDGVIPASPGHRAYRCTARLHSCGARPGRSATMTVLEDRIAMADGIDSRPRAHARRHVRVALEKMPVPEGYKVEIVGGNIFMSPQRDTHWEIIRRSRTGVWRTVRHGCRTSSPTSASTFPAQLNGFAPGRARRSARARRGAPRGAGGTRTSSSSPRSSPRAPPTNDYGPKKAAVRQGRGSPST